MLVHLQPCGMSPVCERADISTAPEHSVEMETLFQGWLELIPAKPAVKTLQNGPDLVVRHENRARSG